MNYLFYLGHPAHFHLFRNIINELKFKGHSVSILIKTKDILENLLIDSGMDYLNILLEGRKDSMVGLATGLAKRSIKMFFTA